MRRYSAAFANRCTNSETHSHCIQSCGSASAWPDHSALVLTLLLKKCRQARSENSPAWSVAECRVQKKSRLKSRKGRLQPMPLNKRRTNGLYQGTIFSRAEKIKTIWASAPVLFCYRIRCLKA